MTVTQGFHGIRPDVPAGVVELTPAPGLGAIRVEGLRVAGHALDLAVDADGHCSWSTPPAGLTFRVAT